MRVKAKKIRISKVEIGMTIRMGGKYAPTWRTVAAIEKTPNGFGRRITWTDGTQSYATAMQSWEIKE